MSRHKLVGRFGLLDRSPVAVDQDEVLTQLDLVASQRRLGYGLGQALEDLVGIGVCPTELGLDTAVLAALVHAADTRISRGTESQDSWTRQLHLVVPVSEPVRWNGVVPLLKRMLDFLTGDRWDLTFRPRPADFTSLLAPSLPHAAAPFNCVSLFSGGADSLLGAIDLLADGASPLFVSHAGDGPTSDAQSQCFEALRGHFGVLPFDRLRVWTAFPEGLVTGVERESTTRGRSFLFIALGVLAATGLPKPFKILVPENGLIALNVPLDPLRLGSLSTKTTHPFYLECWNELISQLGIEGRVENPYAFATKGEMVRSCRAPNVARDVLPLSLSCASPAKGRWQGHGIEHCGYCVPCLIRRAALEAAWGRGTDRTRYTISDLEAQPLNSLQAEGKHVRSFQLALARLQARPALARLLIHKPGPLTTDVAQLDAFADVYSRGLAEVGVLLKSVVTTPN